MATISHIRMNPVPIDVARLRPAFGSAAGDPPPISVEALSMLLQCMRQLTSNGIPLGQLIAKAVQDGTIQLPQGVSNATKTA